MANHLTPVEIAEQRKMDPAEVVDKCREMGIPIFNGRIDKSLFALSLKAADMPRREPAKH